ncbi:hypothetical protein GSS88_07375 [Corynebacterium sp. 3HC-13]|uniref:hypothetical protein n=1 Tax=Corynebacterium poyangense TaxID=2684405 RepID=UPI001CCD356C|nr:hypothetical protein [Corynebacterium poyangense]MBZ8177611.1 hypothetical protein [Corynebacterium poyangense]
MSQFPTAFTHPEACREDLKNVLDTHLSELISSPSPQLWVPPDLLPVTAQAQESGLVPGSFAGFPHGHHDTLVKAAEARLAVQHGAGAIAVVLPPDLRQDPNAALSELVMLREAVPQPVRLSLLLTGTGSGSQELLRMSARAGVDSVILQVEHAQPPTLELKVLQETALGLELFAPLSQALEVSSWPNVQRCWWQSD